MLDLRKQYFVPLNPDGTPSIELRAFTHGLMPRTVPGMMDAFVSDWRINGVDAWNAIPDHWSGRGSTSWWALPEHLGDRFIAPLLGAPEGSCIHQPHVHWTVSCLLSCDEPFAGDRNEVVCSEIDFPSVLHTVQRWGGLRAIKPVIVPPTREGYFDADRIVEAISDRTAIVFVSHVGFTTGELVSSETIREIARHCRQHGTLLAVDGYHAGTTMPIGVTELECDVYFGGLLKEGSGSTGNAYLYVRPGLDLSPRLSGWFGEGDPFGFNVHSEDHGTVRRRFLGGTTAIASMYHAVEGVKLLLNAGLPDVRLHSVALTEIALERAERAGLIIRSPQHADRRGAMVIIEVPQADRLCAWLKTRGVFTDSRRGRYLRMAPFVWNDEGDVHRAFDIIEEGMADGTYLKAPRETAHGPVT